MKFYNEYLKQYKGQDKSLAVVQVGDRESETRQIKEFKKDCENLGIEFQWYWYNENIPKQQLKQEVNDLKDYVDYLVIWNEVSPKIGIIEYAKRELELPSSVITVIGDEEYAELAAEGAVVIHIPTNSNVNKWNFLRVDLIITEEEINCYSLYGPIIDINDKCINKEDRLVMNKNLFIRIGILEALKWQGEESV